MPASTSAPAAPAFFLLCNLCSPEGRAYPDIAAQSLNFVVVVKNVPLVVSGTSCSTPVCLSLLPTLSSPRRPTSSAQLTTNIQTVAGIISLLNDYRISHRKPPLGFLNPWLYSDGPSVLNDITSGSNPGCDTDGFSAIAGWDPVRPARLLSYHFILWLMLYYRSRVWGRQILKNCNSRSKSISRRYLMPPRSLAP